MKLLLDLGAHQVAGRIIHLGRDLAFWRGTEWHTTPDGHKFIEEQTQKADGVEVLEPVAQAAVSQVAQAVARSPKGRQKAEKVAEAVEVASQAAELMADLAQFAADVNKSE